MKKITQILAFLIFIVTTAYTQEIPQHIKDKFIKATDYKKSGQYDNALSLFNQIIDYTELTNNSNLTKLLKQQKIACYFKIAEEKAINDNKYGLKEACTKGLRLCDETGESYSLSSMMFSLWIAGYYYMNDEYRKCSYAIEYSKRLVNECRKRKITDNEVFIELETMIAGIEREVNRQINPPSTFSFSLNELFNSFTSSSFESNNSTSNERESNSISNNESKSSQTKFYEDGFYIYGSYKSIKYKVICPDGDFGHIYYNLQKRCWMKTSSVYCDYSSTKGEEGLKKSANIFCKNR